jgi:hypothetical protein
MWRKVGAFTAGFFAWGGVGLLGFIALRAAWPEYAAAEPSGAFSLSMQLWRLSIGALCSIAAGCAVAIAVGRRSRIPFTLGVVLLVIFTPVHIQLWDKFPVWYHLFFLGTLVPLVAYGARLIPHARGASVAEPNLTEANPS